MRTICAYEAVTDTGMPASASMVEDGGVITLLVRSRGPEGKQAASVTLTRAQLEAFAADVLTYLSQP